MSSAERTLTEHDIGVSYRNTARSAGAWPDLAITTVSLWQEYCELVGPRLFFRDWIELDGILYDIDANSAVAEVNNLEVPLLRDPLCPPGRWFWFNSKTMGDEMRQHVRGLLKGLRPRVRVNAL